ncbi:MAG: V-type ATP synthase subunit E, partial [Christensenellales bacterium]
KALSVVEKEKNEIIRRRETVARLDVNKMMLGAKQRVLDKVFEQALEILENLPEDRYQELIEGMLSKYASDGDVVTVRKDRKATLTKVFFQAYGKLNGIKLGYDVKGGDFRGGMILSSDGVDKNLTFEVELQSLRDEIEPEIAAKLFSVVE